MWLLYSADKVTYSNADTNAPILQAPQPGAETQWLCPK